MRPGRLFLSILFSVIYITVTAQIKSVSGTVTDADTKKPLPFSTVINADDYFKVITDKNGRFTISSSSDSSRFIISYIGYKTVEIFAKEAADSIELNKESYNLQAVTVSGEENSITENSTYIGETALSYLQPAGLKDVFQLLPGNVTENPDLSTFNAPLIREIDYNNISSLGTALIIDGVQVSSNAKMQNLTTAFNYQSIPYINSKGYPFAKGNDLRAFTTENIKSINIIKGIPTVQYGDMTSAVIDIKTNVYSLETKAKVKYSPNLTGAGISKGIRLNPNNTLGGNIYYTSSTGDVRLPLSMFKRLNAELGSRHLIKENHLLTSKISGYFTLDKQKNDADLIVENENYTEDNSGLKMILRYQSWNTDKLLNQFDLSFNANVDRELIKINEYMFGNEVKAFTSTNETGENFGQYVPAETLASYSLEGVPVSFAIKSKFNFSKSYSNIKTHTLLGTDLNYEKNIGNGLDYKGKYPPVTPDFISRKLKFSDIPALYHGAVFLEESLNKTTRHHRIDAQIGIRQTFYNSGSYRFKTYSEPRLNASYRYSFNPESYIALHGGFGIQYKIPIMRYLYPDTAWFDMISYNLYDTSDPGNSYLVYTTQNRSTQNHDLRPAKSKKAEISITFNNRFLHAVFTAFRESHSDGLFLLSNYINSTYRIYNQNQPVNTKLLPEEQNLSYSIANYYNKFYYPENGVYTLKEGIEYSIRTERINPIQTYIDLTGAWFRTKNIGNTGIYYNLPFSNNSIQYDYIGIYKDGYGKLSERLTSNLRFITHLPKESLVFSFSLETIWIYSYQFLRTYNVPLSLIDRNGNISDFTNDMLNDPYFENYIKTPLESHYLKEYFPVTAQINMKISKEIRNVVKVSFLANNIFNNRPLVKQRISNTFIRVNTPLYFGLELSFNY
ncbi:carboxypeptidase-like regulatory domain-containing protein [Saccharicrinis sp. FJH62]|uniref:carboxypeptidase-like regulatory domain-containing protein n=1 Tax=Saccharicrinis sp. FJH62 TaxID=3344657 RepID=UPI0035D44FFE